MHVLITNYKADKITFMVSVNLFVVVCDPPCMQGACVSNDTCNCAEGYIGERCTEPGMYITFIL